MRVRTFNLVAEDEDPVEPVPESERLRPYSKAKRLPAREHRDLHDRPKD